MKKQSEINQLKVGVVLSYLITGINMFIQIFYTPIMIRLLGQSEYGLYTLVGSVVSYLSLFSLGFTGAYLRFYFRYKTQNNEAGLAKLNGMFLTLFLGMGVLAIICGMILSCYPYQLFGSNLNSIELRNAEILMRLLVLNIAMTFPLSLFDSMVCAHEKFIFQRILALLGIIFNPFICVPLLLMGYGSVAIVTVTTVITFVKLVIDIWFCTQKLFIKFAFKDFDYRLLKEISGFSFFIFLNMITTQLNWSVDKYILGRVAGTVIVAIYGVGSQLNNVFMNLGTMIPNIFAPRVNRIVSEKQENCDIELTNLFLKVGRITFFIVFYIFIGFVFCGRAFVQVWAGSEYAEAYIVALLLIFPLIIASPRHLGIEIRRAKNMHKVPTIMLLGISIFNALISIPLAVNYGASGAAFGTVLALFINYLLTDIYYIKVVKLNVLLLYRNILKILRGLIIPIVFGLLGLMWNDMKVGIIWAIVYSGIYMFCAYKFSMNYEEKILVRGIIDKLIKRK